jgi:segregation and condensation protein B
MRLGPNDARRLASEIETLLFIADEPIDTRRLQTLLNSDRKGIETALDDLDVALAERGIRLERGPGGFRLVTAPENADLVRTFLLVPRQVRLSRPALETLAIIAYRQPITRAELESFRGVTVDRVLTNLVRRGLAEECGRRTTPGRPIEYRTTSAFLSFFGLQSLDELKVPSHEADLAAAPTEPRMIAVAEVESPA